jgi:hypothetical protein
MLGLESSLAKRWVLDRRHSGHAVLSVTRVLSVLGVGGVMEVLDLSISGLLRICGLGMRNIFVLRDAPADMLSGEAMRE